MVDAPSVCVFCGSAMGRQPSYRDLADEVGTRLAQAGWQIVYGGGHVGLMGVVADAARAHGARVTGVIPHGLVEREVGHPDLDELVVVHTMADRKSEMARRSHAYLVLPGGLGTLDELFEVLTMSQLRFDIKPCVLLSPDEFFSPLREQLDRMHEQGFLPAPVDTLMRVVETVEEAIAALSSSLLETSLVALVDARAKRPTKTKDPFPK